MVRAENLSAYMQGSQAVDETGAPKRLYHATSADFSMFDPKKAARNSGHPASRLGHFLAATPEAADLFSRKPDKFSQGTGEYKPGANIMPVHAAIKNPHVMTWKEFAGALASLNSMPDKKANKEVDAFRQQLVDAGHDGILIKGGWKPGQFLGSPEFLSDNWVAFDPTQIKSATGNQGTFDQFNSDITKADGGALTDDEGITAYHGSPHDFDYFDTDAIGTGEGVQAYGHGLYFASNEDVARDYRDRLGRQDETSGETMADQYVIPRHFYQDTSEEELAENMKEAARWSEQQIFDQGKMHYVFDDGSMLIHDNDEVRAVQKHPGHMYEVHIDAHPDHLLDWDRPIAEQPHMMSLIKNSHVKFLGDLLDEEGRGITGKDLYEKISNVYNPEDASSMMNSSGIKGIKYLDASSRGAGEGTRNYVVFNHDHVKVRRKYTRGGAV